MVQEVKIARGREFLQNRVKTRAKRSDVIALKRKSEVPWCGMRNPRHRPSLPAGASTVLTRDSPDRHLVDCPALSTNRYNYELPGMLGTCLSFVRFCNVLKP